MELDPDDQTDDEFIASIAPDVMASLEHSGFFEKLDDVLCPEESSLPRPKCTGDYTISAPILRASGYEDSDLADIFSVLRSKGGFCDCEILYNAVDSSRLKSDYWQKKALGLDPDVGHGLH